MKHWTDKLRKLRACNDAVEWAKDYPSLTAAWKVCERADWMLWLLGRARAGRKKIVLCACDCARLALPYVLDGEARPLKAIEIAEAWVRGEATIEDVRNAADAAADAAAYAAAYAADAAAKSKILKKCAKIVRKNYPKVDDLFNV